MKGRAACDILLDPIVETEVVELVPRGGIAIIEGGERSRLYLALQHIMHLLEVAIGGLLQVVFVKEEISVLGAVGLRLQEINGLQPEALGHLQDRFMAAVVVVIAPHPPFLPSSSVEVSAPPPPRPASSLATILIQHAPTSHRRGA